MLHRAAAALVHDDLELATSGLRDQLHRMARAARATPDWTTLVVSGPTRVPGLRAEQLFEWVATVHVDDPCDGHLPADTDLDHGVALRSIAETQPVPAVVVGGGRGGPGTVADRAR